MTSQPPLFEEKSVFLTVWDEAWAAISSPRMYVKWALQPLRRSIAYASILFAVMAVVTTVYVWLTVRPQWVEARAVIEESVPPFAITGGQLQIENDQTFTFSDNSDVFIRVDATDSMADLEVDPFYEFGMIVASDGIVVRAEGDVERIPYTEFVGEDFSMDGAGLAAALQKMLVALGLLLPILVFAALFVVNLAYTSFLSGVAVIASGLPAGQAGFRFSFAAVWSMSLYALTPFLLASHVFFVFYPNTALPWLVFLVYMFLALYHYRRFLDLKAQMS